MTTNETALRDALEKIADECEGTAPDGNIVGIASKCHRIAKRALSQPSPASSTVDKCCGEYIAGRRCGVCPDRPSSGEPASVAGEAETLIAAGFDDYAAHCALKTESDGGFCHAYFYSDGQWRFQTGGHDLTIGKDTVRCVLTKRLYAHPPLSKPTPVETIAEKQAREVMNPKSGSVTAPSGGQSYGMLSGCMDFTEPSPPSPQPDMGSDEGRDTLTNRVLMDSRCRFAEKFPAKAYVVALHDVVSMLADAALSPPASQSVEKMTEALERMRAAGEGVLAALDNINEKHGTAYGGPAFFEMGRAIHQARLALPHKEEATPAAVGEQGAVGWRCFHCGDTFTDERSARLHFGRDETSVAACVIKAGAEGSLLKALRDAEEQADDAIQRMHNESTDAALAFHQQRCRHNQALIAAEEAGYEKGLADGRALSTPATTTTERGRG